jgi:hypothetical protein
VPRRALALHARIAGDTRFVTAFAPQLDIVVWAPRAASVSQASALSRALRRGSEAGIAPRGRGPAVSFFDMRGRHEGDRETITCLRSVLMKPEHREWVDRIAALIDSAAAKVLA